MYKFSLKCAIIEFVLCDTIRYIMKTEEMWKRIEQQKPA